jgi:formate hydrogenlyase subunit 6/NADH:ubiquinone oxidoreductase subunit I
MSRRRSLVYLFPQVWRTLFSRPITVRYPFAPLELSPHYRGRLAIEADLCRGCGACVRDCPAFGLELDRASRDCFRLTHYPDRCAYCGQCEASCPSGAIRLVNAYVPATDRREALIEVLAERGSGEEVSDRDCA